MITEVRDRAAVLTDWLMTEARDIHGTPALLDAFCRQLLAIGLPLWRVNWQIVMLHPQLRGTTLIWYHDQPEVVVLERPHGSEFTDDYLLSPVKAVIEDGAEGVRQRFEGLNGPWLYPIFTKLKAQGATDYVAMPVPFSGGRRTCATFATRRAGGFTLADLALIDGLLAALGLLQEKLEFERLAQGLLDIYVGRQAGARILSGDIRLGSNASMRAVLWYCDLRGFTTLAERLPREEIVALLNGYFEIMGNAVHARGGEILKFIGDAMLAIFPLTETPFGGLASEGGESNGETAVTSVICRLALDAARGALDGLRRFNAERAAWGQPTLQCGIAIHLGDVMYGNIGAPTRLDFTVIGSAVNLVTRLESLCKRFDRFVVASSEFAKQEPLEWLSLGFQPVRGLKEPVEVFGLRQ